jgi:osmotically inducible lipoprotein OsmB
MTRTTPILALAVLASAVLLSACGDTTGERAATGALGGAVIAGPPGAIIGGTVGAVVD